jgi:hypothetical protein
MNTRATDSEGQITPSTTNPTDLEMSPSKKDWMSPELREMSVINTATGFGPDGGSFATS